MRIANNEIEKEAEFMKKKQDKEEKETRKWNDKFMNYVHTERILNLCKGELDESEIQTLRKELDEIYNLLGEEKYDHSTNPENKRNVIIKMQLEIYASCIKKLDKQIDFLTGPIEDIKKRIDSLNDEFENHECDIPVGKECSMEKKIKGDIEGTQHGSTLLNDFVIALRTKKTLLKELIKQQESFLKLKELEEFAKQEDQKITKCNCHKACEEYENAKKEYEKEKEAFFKKNNIEEYDDEKENRI